MTGKKRPTALIILDGFGYSERHEGNAIYAAQLENFTRYCNEYPHTLIEASGEAVGLPKGQMGNSEVGHQNIGAGRMVPQELKRINDDIANGSFSHNPEFANVISHCVSRNSALHIMGLMSHGGVHSDIKHLYDILHTVKESGLNEVYIHCFTDGRDVLFDSARDTIAELEAKLRETGCGRIATVSGRYYAMDRDNNFDRYQLAYDAMVNGVGKVYRTADELIAASYENDIYDEFIVPAIVEGARKITDGDGILFINFRPDRAAGIMKLMLFTDAEMESWYNTANEKKRKDFLNANPNGEFKSVTKFKRDKQLQDIFVTVMAQYDAAIDSRMHIAYDKQRVPMGIGEYLSKLGYTQLRIAETEKFKHVTSFFSGNIEEEFDGETRVLISSPSTDSFDKVPQMSAYEVAAECVDRIKSGRYDFIVLNFANPDMVGHTGNFDATVKALKAVDECLKQVVDAVLEAGGRACVTADHGNADEMLYPDGKVCTQHSVNPVPFILLDPDRRTAILREGGALCDIAPTLLDIMGLQTPTEFTGKTLIES